MFVASCTPYDSMDCNPRTPHTLACNELSIHNDRFLSERKVSWRDVGIPPVEKRAVSSLESEEERLHCLYPGHCGS